MRQSAGREYAVKKIQIIEDDRDIVELVRYNLTNEGFEVSSSTDGLSGLAQLRKSLPDLLMLDLMLPKMPGLEICKEIRRDPSLNRLPILMLTAKGEEADRGGRSGDGSGRLCHETVQSARTVGARKGALAPNGTDQ